MMKIEKSNSLPKGWVEVELAALVLDKRADIVDGPFGSNLKAAEYTDSGVPIVRLQNIDRNQFIKKNIRFISADKAESLKRHSFAYNDILITKLGDPLGKACIVPNFVDDGIIVADVVRMRLSHELISRQYLTYAINSDIVIEQFNGNIKGTTRPRVNLNHIRKIRVPLAPLPEQHRIVSKIEELFTKLDAGVEELKRAKAQLRQYRRSVLESAIKGELTRQWRNAHRGDLGSAEKLLRRILADRKEQWEAHRIFQRNARGQNRLTQERISNYEEPKTPVMPLDVPEGWCPARTDQVFSYVTSGSRNWAKYYSDSGAVFVRIGNLEHSDINLDLQNVQYVQPHDGTEGARTRLNANDILISITADVGMVGLVPQGMGEAYINQHVALARPVKSIDPRFLAWVLSSDFAKRQFRNLQRGATKAGLGLEDIKAVDFGLPPIEEQAEIVREVERQFSILRYIDSALQAGFRKSNSLRQSILSSAFNGKLVPQDINDEPAQKLLERIRQCTTKSDQSRRRRKSNGDTSNGK